MESIRWQTGLKGQLEFATQTANRGRKESQNPNEQVELAGLHRISANAKRSDSWVDATVTLLATIVFGLGWAVVELEGADPAQAGYDQAFQTSEAARAAARAAQTGWDSRAIDASMLADTAATESTRPIAGGFRIGEMWRAERERWTDVMAPRSSKQ